MNNGTPKAAQIKYCSLGDGPVKGIEDVMTNSFAKDELTLHLCRNCEGGQPEDHRPWVKEVVRAHDWSISRLAVDADTGAVAGVCLCDTGTPERPCRGMDSIGQINTEACRLLDGLIKQSLKGYDVFKTLGVQKVMYLNFVAVDERYRRQGISHELRRQSLELARQHGCQAVIDLATSPFTRKVLNKLGFEHVKFLPYTESVLNSSERVDLSKCGPEDGCALMICRL